MKFPVKPLPAQVFCFGALQCCLPSGALDPGHAAQPSPAPSSSAARAETCPKAARCGLTTVSLLGLLCVPPDALTWRKRAAGSKVRLLPERSLWPAAGRLGCPEGLALLTRQVTASFVQSTAFLLICPREELVQVMRPLTELRNPRCNTKLRCVSLLGQGFNC